jgi:hypothetical protein
MEFMVQKQRKGLIRQAEMIFVIRAKISKI